MNLGRGFLSWIHFLDKLCMRDTLEDNMELIQHCNNLVHFLALCAPRGTMQTHNKGMLRNKFLSSLVFFSLFQCVKNWWNVCVIFLTVSVLTLLTFHAIYGIRITFLHFLILWKKEKIMGTIDNHHTINLPGTK